ncbi:MAG: UDP-N-acetylmuramoyl-L-alanine--D-glutamate ligase, partial [Planctomycetota bacterium]|nr:UDP-N-acetylmuramoyl-L-alanine--D-glutamate ligase [Planctomycetota bacterium]
ADLDLTFHLGGAPEADFTDTDLVLTNQAVKPSHPRLALARERGIPILTETGLALALNPSPWLGVTGSNGKSTTAALLSAILSIHDPATLFGGNIGGDLLTRVEAHAPTSPLVVELSSYQLLHLGPDLANQRIPPPRVAVVTNLTPNHLDWHQDLAEYQAAKRNLVNCQTPDDWTILNLDDPTLRDWAATLPGRLVATAREDPGTPSACWGEEKRFYLRLAGEGEWEFPLDRFALPGRHNLANARQAVAAAYVYSRSETAVQEGLAVFPGLPHRLERVGVAAGKTFVNDSKGTTPEAAILALAAIPGPKTLIAGGYDKQSPFDQLGEAIQREVAAIALLGVAAPRLRQAVVRAAGKRPAGLPPLTLVECGEDFTRAVTQAWRLCPPGGTVLLSPACASWGMFKNYEERGKRFAEIAANLAKPE